MQDNEIKQDIETTEETSETTGAHSIERTSAKSYKRAEELRQEAEALAVADAEKQLTEFQRKLVHNVVYKSMDQATAAREAGSSAKTREGLRSLAWETLRKPHVACYLNHLMEKKNEMAGIDKVEVIEGLRDILELARADGKYKEALKALELLGSAIGLFKSVSQSTSIKKDAKQSSLLDESDEDSSAKKDLSKLIDLISSNQPVKRK